jgi:hypothetical protein
MLKKKPWEVSVSDLQPVLRIRVLLIRYGFESADQYFCQTDPDPAPAFVSDLSDAKYFCQSDPDPAPALFVSDLSDANKNNFFSFLCLFLFEGTFSKNKKS